MRKDLKTPLINPAVCVSATERRSKTARQLPHMKAPAHFEPNDVREADMITASSDYEKWTLKYQFICVQILSTKAENAELVKQERNAPPVCSSSLADSFIRI